jgi:hypothetical protein
VVTKTVIFAAVALLLSALDGLAADQARSCIAKATEALPKINGLQVKKSSIRPMAPEHLANWKGHSKPIIVDIEVNALGVNERYSYLCAFSPAGAAFVQRTTN